ncbi:MAG TPA: hypothetical protein VJG83_05315 [archaeon]|nr:hypothetical protein [archaeon]
MGHFKKIVQGLYLGLAFASAIFFLDILSPGVIADMAFTPVALISLFSLLILEAMFSL